MRVEMLLRVFAFHLGDFSTLVLAIENKCSLDEPFTQNTTTRCWIKRRMKLVEPS